MSTAREDLLRVNLKKLLSFMEEEGLSKMSHSWGRVCDEFQYARCTCERCPFEVPPGVKIKGTCCLGYDDPVFPKERVRDQSCLGVFTRVKESLEKGRGVQLELTLE